MTSLPDAIWDIDTAIGQRVGWDGVLAHDLWPDGEIQIRCAGDAGVYVRAWLRRLERRGRKTDRRLVLLPRTAPREET